MIAAESCIKEENFYFNMFMDYGKKAKHLYNATFRIMRKYYKENGTIPEYQDLLNFINKDKGYYKKMPTPNSAGMTIHEAYETWKGYYDRLKKWEGNKSEPKPEMPHYLQVPAYDYSIGNGDFKVDSGKVIWFSFNKDYFLVTRHPYEYIDRVVFMPRGDKILVGVEGKRKDG